MPLRTPKPILLVLELAERERRFILSETVKVKGLMPVLMKRRNKQQWSMEDREEIRTQLLSSGGHNYNTWKAEYPEAFTLLSQWLRAPR